jgi:sulfur relay (sulfurtransferase) DsrF/TusC family protein
VNFANMLEIIHSSNLFKSCKKNHSFKIQQRYAYEQSLKNKKHHNTTNGMNKIIAEQNAYSSVFSLKI